MFIIRQNEILHTKLGYSDDGEDIGKIKYTFNFLPPDIINVLQWRQLCEKWLKIYSKLNN